IWLQQIARHQCQDWLRKEKTYIQLDENIICETPLADEVLILRETLAKVIKAIDELPKSESQLLKERYLDDVSYDDLEAKHGLSHSVLAMRLFRARQHVREKIKLLSGVLALSWQDMAKKIFVGGVKIMKISAKAKILTIGIAAVLILGGTGVVVWYYQEPNIKAQDSIGINQVDQGKVATNHNNQPSDKKDSLSKLSEKQKIEQIDKAISYLDSLEKNSSDEINLTKSGVKTGESIPTEETKKLKTVRDFPEFDLSTPESAWATMCRVLAQGSSREDWIRVSLSRDREMIARSEFGEEKNEKWLDAEIVEVYSNGSKAVVISQTPGIDRIYDGIKHPFDIRSLMKENGEWRNVANMVATTIEEARRIDLDDNAIWDPPPPIEEQ
ncbi:MAG: sigma-70 family RNA polymerase sigma factor, partial [Proteobacteria bacterium]|nr:sigma-70 family RNA polymerase sigma factor [Pseudomonadota bacterium]